MVNTLYIVLSHIILKLMANRYSIEFAFKAKKYCEINEINMILIYSISLDKNMILSRDKWFCF